jgi:GTP:adenosylcobinamide-phosphate guanylyltransferase
MAQNQETNEKMHPGYVPDGIGTVTDSDSASVEHAETASQTMPGYGAPIDAIVLSGTHQNERRLIGGRNKAFLEIGGKALVDHVVDALVGAAQIDQIYVVGPADELEKELTDDASVHCVPQEGKMLSNGWAAIRAAEAAQGDLDQDQVQQRPLLIISCDLPLISPAAIDDFVVRCARIDSQSPAGNAMLTGCADRPALEPFHGDGEQSGIERPFVQLRECELRLANIYVARPRLLAHSDYLQTSFSYRKAIDWRNVIKLVFSMFTQHGGWAAAWLTVRLQAAAMLKKGDGRLYRRIRAGNTVARMERGVSTVLGGPVRIVVTPYGGLSLDVDDEEDFRILSENYQNWTQIMDSVDPDRI